jgi:tetratricopeptide (TPR) repeat protein
LEQYEQQERDLSALLLLARDEALARAAEAGRTEQGRTWSLYAVAELLRSECEFEQAASEIRVVLERDPESPLAWALWLFLSEGDPVRKIRTLERLSEGWPRLVRPRFYLGYAYARVRDVSRSLEAFETCVELNPSDLESWNGVADLAITARLRDRAVDAATKVAELSRARAGYLVGSSRVLFRARRYRDAWNVSRAAVQARTKRSTLLLPWTLPIWASGPWVQFGLLVACSCALVWAGVAALTGQAPFWLFLIFVSLAFAVTSVIGRWGGGGSDRCVKALNRALKQPQAPPKALATYLELGQSTWDDDRAPQWRRTLRRRRVLGRVLVLGYFAVLLAVAAATYAARPMDQRTIVGTFASSNCNVQLVPSHEIVVRDEDGRAVGRAPVTLDAGAQAPACRFTFRLAVPNIRTYGIFLGISAADSLGAVGEPLRRLLLTIVLSERRGLVRAIDLSLSWRQNGEFRSRVVRLNDQGQRGSRPPLRWVYRVAGRRRWCRCSSTNCHGYRRLSRQ